MCLFLFAAVLSAAAVTLVVGGPMHPHRHVGLPFLQNLTSEARQQFIDILKKRENTTKAQTLAAEDRWAAQQSQEVQVSCASIVDS